STVAMRGATFLDGVVAGLLHQLRVRRQQVSAVGNRASAVGTSGGRRVPRCYCSSVFALGAAFPTGAGAAGSAGGLTAALGAGLTVAAPASGFVCFGTVVAGLGWTAAFLAGSVFLSDFVFAASGVLGFLTAAGALFLSCSPFLSGSPFLSCSPL